MKEKTLKAGCVCPSQAIVNTCEQVVSNTNLPSETPDHRGDRGEETLLNRPACR